MFSFVIAIIVGIWFFISARAVQKSTWMWALIGAAAYAGVGTLVANLSFWLASPIRHDELAQTGIIIVVGSLIFAFVVTLLIHRAYLRKDSDVSRSEPNGQPNP